jgi:hypothetical protein
MGGDGGAGGGWGIPLSLAIALVGVLSALIGAGATVVTTYLTSASKDQELKAHLVETAVSILRADPNVTPARGWALDVIDKNSDVKFSKEEREALLHKPLVVKAVLSISEAPDRANVRMGP